ncbi:thrombospondin [Capsaspora owczarzaki ATCC 30864]|uniref:Thrombospondin n=1 Tax=Capsaspora owczarzaki (strain ATCC 30864) TaxID=595528 RepID=A0A0D2X393_CAPO3|nr:thrombospondin [Capsaspora owczarzaki ATCC 30864]KJE93909.1 thrombospondin [Capsaspora owczarzaki ATCC 30864]|eukprot:XP_004347374.1 thrombospondin [Capsaspora owczarzaki ATCC 30864]
MTALLPLRRRPATSLPPSPSLLLLLLPILATVAVATENEYFSTSDIYKLYPVTSATVSIPADKPTVFARRAVWDFVVAPTQMERRARRSASLDLAESLERLQPHDPFPDHIEVSFVAADGSAETASVQLFREFFTEDARIFTSVVVNGTTHVEEHVPVLRAFRGETTAGFPVSVVLHDEEGMFHMVVFDPAGHYTIEPAARHLDKVAEHQHRRNLQAATAATGLVLFHGADSVFDLLSGVVNHEDVRRAWLPTSQKTPKSIVLPLNNNNNNNNDDADARRTVSKWTSCFPGGDTNMYAISAAFAVDTGYYRWLGSSTANVQLSVIEIMTPANVLYNTQVNVYIRTSTIDIRTALDSDTWNQIPSTPGQRTCLVDIDGTGPVLTSFATWRKAKPATQTNGIYHLLTNCFPPAGTVGLASVGVLCDRRYAGVSSWSSSVWITVAHEMGHNFGAQHTFGYGGLMDYTDGKYLGEYQFYSPLNKAQVCTGISNSMGANYPSGATTYLVPTCWSVMGPICGNGLVEPGEDCDDTTTCCSNCKFSDPSYECSLGACCSSCKFVSTSTLCLNGYGQCANGHCISVAGGCAGYSNVQICPTAPVTASNPCALNCQFVGSSSCASAQSMLDTVITVASLPIGTVCSHSPLSTCQNYSGTVSCRPAVAGCGNGVIEPGETCDDTSACCNNCQLVAGAECSGGQCCLSTCKYALPATGCATDAGAGTGYCSNGQCLTSGCEKYSNTAHCGSNPSNLCEEFCSYSGSGCASLNYAYFAAGTICNRSPYSTCVVSGGKATCVATTQPTVYTWSSGSWSACSPSCGAGTQTRTVTCVNSASTTVSDSLCTGTKPATSQSCNNGACGSYAWQQSGFGACSVPCGSGTQTQTVQCVNTASGNAVVADSFCTGTKPSTSQSCSSTACGWYTGSFGTCSPSCGAGTQTRTVECRTNAGNGVAASSTYCTGTQPATSQSCNNGACPAYAWQQSGFGACSVPCGSGTQTQTVQCVNTAASNAVVADSLCTGTKPSTSQSCSSTACGWFTGSFGACSPSCGAGTQTRTVECRTNAGNGVAASSTYCTGTQPATSQSCNNGACPVYSWQQSGFGACSVPCGSGTQTQTVQCVNTAASNAVVADSLCTGTKPSTSQSCSSTACGWFTGSFGACSPSCGAGTQTRTVECRTNAGNGVAASSTYCTDTQPAASQSCNNGACGSYVWQQSGFGACSVPCGSGTQTQTVQCVNTAASNAVVADSLCTGTKPSTSQSCSSTACGWFTGSFGACSPSCGAGTQTRTVECRTNAGNGVAASSTYCTGTQPATSQSCNNGACPVYAWKQSGFGACSVPCGSGTQTQTVQCVNTAAGDAIVSDSLCTGTKPSASQSCSSTVCGWYAGTFGVCSVTCSGTGTQTRTVECRTNGGNGATVADTYCSGTQPASSQSCNNGACPTYAWQQSGFGACSPSCGAGTQTQTVQCVNTAAANAVVSDSLCTGTKPSTSQACNNGVCPSYSWQQSGFGGCTQPCGGGTQSQTVQCVNTAAGNAVVADSLCTGTKPATSQSCNTGACPSYSWQQSGFGACSASCGTGTQTQTVQCVNTASGNTVVADSLCSGTKPASSRNCNTHVCPPAIDCSCTAWSVFAPCSVSCGSGVQKSYRTCTEARDGGRTCAQLGLTSTVRQQACNTQACPVDCSCGAWTGPTACSATCGGGKQTYTRTCTEASAGGLTCAAMGLKTTRQVTCNSGSCPTPANRDCSCSAWSSWSTCSRNCGTGAQFRTRTCSAAVGSGQTCAALGLTSTSEYRSCNSFVCALPTKYMVALFSFDGSGPSFTDSQGNVFSWSSALTRRDTSTTVPAIRGNAAEFGGSASMALTSGPRLYEVTLSAFIQPSAMASGTAFIRAPNAGTTNFFVSFRTNGGRVTPFVNVGSTTLAATLSSSIPTTSWSHIAVTLNADGALTVYLNGTQVAARTGATIPTTSIAPGNWEIACFDAETNCYSGAMDELSVWNAALSAEEVAELYNRYFSGLSSTSDRGSPAPASGSDGGSSIVPVIVGVVIGLLVVLIIVIVLVRRHRRNANYNHVKKMARRNSVDSNDPLTRDKSTASLDTQTPAMITNARANKHQSLATMAVTANPLLSASAAAAPAPAKKPGRLGQMTFGRRSAASNAAAAGAADNAVEQPEVGALFRAQYAYQPHQSDELELAIGDVIHVTSQSDDGWMLGKNNRTKKHGVCPGNYLVRMDANDTTAIPTGTLSVAAAKAAEAASSSPAKAPKPAKVPRPTVSETANPVFSHTENDTPSPKPTPPAKPSTLPPKLGSSYKQLGSSDSLLNESTTPPSKPAPLAPSSTLKPTPPPGKPAPPAGKPAPPAGKPTPPEKPSLPAGKPMLPPVKPAPPAPKSSSNV